MAKKGNTHEVDLFDEFDDGLDDLFGNQDDDKPLTRIEKARRVARGTGLGMLDALKSRQFIINTLNRTIPSEYGVDLRVIDDVATSVEGLYHEAVKEGEEVNQALREAVGPLIAKNESKLPTKLRERAKRWLEQGEVGAGGLAQQESEEDGFVQSWMQDLFKVQEVREDLREEERRAEEGIKEALERKYRTDSLTLSDKIRSSLERLVGFQDKITANYQRKSLEIGMRQYFVAAKSMEILRENAVVTQENLKAIHKEISKPDILRLREHPETRRLYGGNRAEKGLFGRVTSVADRIRENAEKRVRDAIQAAAGGAAMALGVIPMASSMDEMSFEDKYTSRGRTAGSFVADGLASILGDRVRRRIARSERGQELGGRVRFLTSNFRNILEEARLNETVSYDDQGREKFNLRGTVARTLHSLIGDERGSELLQTDSLESLQRAHPYTKQTNRTINEVIPGLLGRIHQELAIIRTGEDAPILTYDYLKGDFSTTQAHAKRVVGDLLLRTGGDRISEDARTLVESVDSNNLLTDGEREDLMRFLMRQSHDRRLGSRERLTDADTFNQFDPEQAKLFASIFEQYFATDDPIARQNEFTERYNRLMNSSSMSRDDFHALINTGQGQYLEQAGLIKDGRIDIDALINAYLTYDYSQVHGDTRREVFTERDTRHREEQEKLQEMERFANLFGQTKERFKDSSVGQRLEALRERTKAVGTEAKEKVISSEAYEYVQEQIEALNLDPRDISKEQMEELLTGAQARIDGVKSRLSGAQQSVMQRIRALRPDTQSSYERLQSTSVTGSSSEELTEPLAEQIGEEFHDVGDRLEDPLKRILNLVEEKFEYDRKKDEGPRKGSYEDLIAQRKKKERRVESHANKEHDERESGFGLLNTILGGLSSLFGLGGKLGGLATSALGALGAGSLLGGGAGALPGSGGTVAPKQIRPTTIPRRGGRFGRLGSLARFAGRTGRGALRLGGRAAMLGAGMVGLPMLPVTGTLKGAALLGKGALGLSKLGLAAGKMALPMVKALAAPVLMNPVTLAVGGAALAAYGVYRYINRTKLTELNRIRLTQYGFDSEDLDQLKTVMKIEHEFLKGITINTDHIPRLNAQRVNFKAVIKAAGVSEDDQQAMGALENWLVNRFMPIYLVHIGVLHKISGKMELKEIESLREDDILEYVQGVRFEDGPYTEGYDYRTGDPLPSGPEEVQAVWQAALEYARSKATNKDKAKGAGVASSSAAATAALAQRPDGDGLTDDVPEPEEKDQPTGMLAKLGGLAKKAFSLTPVGMAASLAAKFRGKLTDRVSAALGKRVHVPRQIQALDAIRFKLYGLHTMNSERIRLLLELEQYCEDGLEFDSNGDATWEGHVQAVLAEFGTRFGIASPESAEAWAFKRWFSLRFLPVYTRAMSVVYRTNKSTRLKDGLERLNGEERLNLAQEILATTTQRYGDNDVVSVWLIAYSPWPRYILNTYPDTVEPNLNVLREQARNTELGEQVAGTPKASQAPETEESTQPHSAAQRAALSNPPSPSQPARGGGGASGGAGASMDWDDSSSAGPSQPSGTWDSGVGSFSMSLGTGGKADQLPDPQGDGSFEAYRGLIGAVAKMVGVDPVTLASLVAIESGFKTNAKAPTSTATGLGQFIRATWNAMIKKYGDKYGIPAGTDPRNPKANLLMTAEYIKENAQYLKNRTSKKNLAPVDIYMAHFLGPGGYSNFLNAGPNAVGAAVNSAAANANKSIFYDKSGRPRTTAQIVKLFEKRLVARAKSHGIQMSGFNEEVSAQSDTPPENTPQADQATQTVLSGNAVIDAATGMEPSVYENLDLGQAYNRSNTQAREATTTHAVDTASTPAPSAASAIEQQVGLDMPDYAQDQYGSAQVSEAMMTHADRNALTGFNREQEPVLRSQAQNDPLSKLVGTTNDVLTRSLGVQTNIYQVLVQIHELLPSLARVPEPAAPEPSPRVWNNTRERTNLPIPPIRNRRTI